MKSGLELRTSTQLRLTPQLYQGLRFLQLPILELKNEIEEKLLTNPFLEAYDYEENYHETLENNSLLPKTEMSYTENFDHKKFYENKDISFNQGMDSFKELEFYSSSDEHISSFNEVFLKKDKTLHEVLNEQMLLAPFNPVEKLIATVIIDSINEQGYFKASLEEIVMSLTPYIQKGMDIKLDEIESVLRKIQSFDPPGVGSRNLRECLLLQLEQMDKREPVVPISFKIVEQYFEQLVEREFKKIRQHLHLSYSELKSALMCIQTLNPYPGDIIQESPDHTLIPDLIVRKVRDYWTVNLNESWLPTLRINSMYSTCLEKIKDKQSYLNMRTQLQEARIFIKNIKNRNTTLLRVACSLVHYQIDFFEYGTWAFKPLLLSQIATELSLHESTISRVIHEKYMCTPRGLFELKYFFSSHVTDKKGCKYASKSIQALIKDLIESEDVRQPMTDDRITHKLLEKGYPVTRRTVTKYRKKLKIPSSAGRFRISKHKLMTL